MRYLLLLVVGTLGAMACAPAPSGVSTAEQPPAAAGPKRVSLVSLGDPGYFSQAAYTGQGRVPGAPGMFALSTSGLTTTDGGGVRIPLLGTGVPSTTDGSWRVLPDGRMETTSTIKLGTAWHDGTPMTAEDLVFSVKAYLDRSSGLLGGAGVRAIEGAEATDSHTAVVRWKTPYIRADDIFDTLVYVLPQHILAAPQAEGSSLLELSYWREEFVGNGPFKLKEWVPNSSASFEAFDRYVLGRPKIDFVEVKFITDPNTVIANVLAGSLDLVLDGIVSIEQAEDTAGRWPAGRLVAESGNSITIYAQYLTPDPQVVANPDFRRALLMAQDRQALNDSFQGGQGSVSHTTVFQPSAPEFSSIEKSIVKYPLDPRRAVGLIEGLGYTRGPDGLFRDTSGERLSVEFRTITREPQSKMVLAIADNWRGIGVEVNSYIIPDQQARDQEYRANFPAFQLLQQNTGFEQFHGANSPLPSTRYVGQNKGRINDPQINGWVDRYNVTIPWDERMEIAGQLIRRITDEVIYMPTIYRANAALVANRVKNIEGVASSWNVHLWAVAN